MLMRKDEIVAGRLAQTVALNGLRSRAATGCQDVEAHGIQGQDKDKSLREIADPTNQGSAPAGDYLRR
jgi:hypothetical protein